MRTDEERRTWREKMRGFAAKVRAMSEEERAKFAEKMPVVTCEGHALSLWNQCYLAMQCERPLTIVGGFRQWRRQGRIVRQGEHAVGYIMIPMIKGKRDGDGSEGEEPDDSVRFRNVPVFDVSQTEAVGRRMGRRRRGLKD